MRALIFELRPESLETEGVVVALAKQSASLQARHGIVVRLNLCDEPTLSLPVKESLYRVAREALHNVVKHANATEVTLTVAYEENSLRIEISDNGDGFDPDQEYPGHLGLHSMRERIAQIGGELSIWSAPNQGARLTAVIPLQSNTPED
jgi:signal transduction histidine kinase